MTKHAIRRKCLKDSGPPSLSFWGMSENKEVALPPARFQVRFRLQKWAFQKKTRCQVNDLFFSRYGTAFCRREFSLVWRTALGESACQKTCRVKLSSRVDWTLWKRVSMFWSSWRKTPGLLLDAFFIIWDRCWRTWKHGIVPGVQARREIVVRWNSDFFVTTKTYNC